MAQAPSRLRSLALFTAGALLPLPVLAGCSSDADESAAGAVPQDIAPLDRDKVADGGTLDWAVDTMPETLNAFQADADAATARITGAVLPSLFPLDARGRPRLNPDFLESAEVVEREPRQVVLYKLSQQAAWSDGREIGAQDFAAQWRALSGKDNAYWTARNAGYERIQKVERGANDLEVKVTFARPYADWKSLFTPLYPKEVMGGPDAFNDGARSALKVTAGPYLLQDLDREGGSATLVPNRRWWGDRPRLEKLVFRAVPREKRAAELAAGRLDLAEIDPATARRVVQAHGPAAGGRKGAPGAPGAPAAPGEALGLGPAAGTTAAAASALRSWAVAHGSDARKALEEKEARAVAAVRAAERNALRGYDVRKSLEPAYTQLALNGSSGPLADERVRRAVARAIDRHALAEAVLGPLGMPTAPLGSHLAMAGQAAYADNSGALGKQDVKEAQALLADAGWERSGPLEGRNERNKAAEEKNAKTPKGEKEGKGEKERPHQKAGSTAGPADGKPPAQDPADARGVPGAGASPGSSSPGGSSGSPFGESAPLGGARAAGHTVDRAGSAPQGGAPGAYAPAGTPAGTPAPAAGPLAKNGKPLVLRFVLPSGPGSGTLRATGGRIARMLARIGVRTETVKVPDDSFFTDHIANGDFDLALYSWPATAYPATDARPIHVKPKPAPDGSLIIEQNYTRVGTDHIDQLFDQAVSELDEKASNALLKKADARIWAAAGSIPLFQRPQLVAAGSDLANAGAFGLGTPRYQDIGFRKPGLGGPAAGRGK